MLERNLQRRTFHFASRIIRLCRVLSSSPGISRQLGAQLVRSGTSVGANYEEAKAAHTRREFACKMSLVLREARETHYWLRLISASGLMPPEDLREVVAEADELVAIFTTAVRKAKQPPVG